MNNELKNKAYALMVMLGEIQNEMVRDNFEPCTKEEIEELYGIASEIYNEMDEMQNNKDDLSGQTEPHIYIGRYDLLDGGVEAVEDFSEEEAKGEMERERKQCDDKRIDTYTLKELEAEINNDLDEDEPFSLKYWIRIF